MNSEKDKPASGQEPAEQVPTEQAPTEQAQTEQAQTEQERAIHEYLQSLLIDSADESTDNSHQENVQQKNSHQVEKIKEQSQPLAEKEPLIKTPVIGLEQLVAEIPEIISQTVNEVETETVSKVKLATLTDISTDTLADSQLAQQPALDEESAVPDWAQSRFQCLLFKVSGLSLAVPLVKLNSVISWNEKITKTPNRTNWYLGLIQHLQHQVKIIDTALLVMPENRRAVIETDPEKRLSHILLVDNYQWGLACDSIGDVIWLTQDDVKWRKNKTTRAWLSGTSLEHLCAVMDTEVFAQMLTKTS